MNMTAKELAAMLGVSPSAVSIALNDKKGISDETRQRILSAASQYNLKPVSRKKAPEQYIMLAIYKKHGQVLSDTDFFSAVIEGITSRAVECGFSLLLNYVYGEKELAGLRDQYEESDCSGIIFFSTEMDEDDMRILDGFRLPHVILDSFFAKLHHNYVTINNLEGSYLATKYLLEQGHRRIGYICSKIIINNFMERRRGMIMAMKEYEGCTLQTISVLPTQVGAYESMSEWLKEENELDSTAFFVDNDTIAVSVIRALTEKGYSIPNDFSIAGFDDMPVTRVMAPRLTTIRVEKETLGRTAVNRLCSAIKDNSFTIHEMVGVSLVVRDSVQKYG